MDWRVCGRACSTCAVCGTTRLGQWLSRSAANASKRAFPAASSCVAGIPVSMWWPTQSVLNAHNDEPRKRETGLVGC